jgi:quercetin dioxygenase-like cupin family protein
MLIGFAGSGLVVTRDAVQAIADGTVVHAFAGEVHWHGAAPDTFMSHQSIVLGGDTEWLEEVSDADYLAALAELADNGAEVGNG